MRALAAPFGNGFMVCEPNLEECSQFSHSYSRGASQLHHFYHNVIVYVMVRHDPEVEGEDSLESLRDSGELRRAPMRAEQQPFWNESDDFATLILRGSNEETLVSRQEVKHSEARLPIFLEKEKVTRAPN